MNKKQIISNPEDYSPQRLGLGYDPPQIIIEYMIPSSGKLYHHRIYLKQFSARTIISDVVDEIYITHRCYLMNQTISRNYIIDLITKIKSKIALEQVNQTPISSTDSMISQQSRNEDSRYFLDSPKEYSINTNEDMNCLTKEQLDLRKREMDKYYEINQIRVGNKDFQYDIRKDFSSEEYDAEWDED